MSEAKKLSEHWGTCDDYDCWLCHEEEATKRLSESIKKQFLSRGVPVASGTGEYVAQEIVSATRPATFEAAFDFVVSLARRVMLDRHRKYGRGNIDAFGKLGVLVRLSDKIVRLRTLLLKNRGGESTDESEIDTWIDVANYGVIGLELLFDIWGLPMEEELPKAPKRNGNPQKSHTVVPTIIMESNGGKPA